MPIDWNDPNLSDEAVVRAAVPDVQIGRESNAWQVWSNDLDGKVLGWNMRSKAEAWGDARENSIVVAFEAANRPTERKDEGEGMPLTNEALAATVASQAAEMATLRQELVAERERADKVEAKERWFESRRKHTQEWYARHYAKLHDWARTRLPHEWRSEFFSCVANGTWGIGDQGKRYRCVGGFDVVPSGYIPIEGAKGIIIFEQTTRAEEAEIRAETAEADAQRLREAINWACGCTGDFGESKPSNGGAFWWRSELTRRARLCYNGTEYVAALSTPDTKEGV